MQKTGDHPHSYVLGAFTDKLQANLLGKIEKISLENKYNFSVIEIEAFDSESVKINVFFEGTKEFKEHIIVKHYQDSFNQGKNMKKSTLHLASLRRIELFDDELKLLLNKLSLFSKEERSLLLRMKTN